MARRNKSKILPNQKDIVNKIMKMTRSKSFSELEFVLGISRASITGIYHGKRGISPFLFFKILFVTNMTVKELFEVLEIDPISYEWV